MTSEMMKKVLRIFWPVLIGVLLLGGIWLTVYRPDYTPQVPGTEQVRGGEDVLGSSIRITPKENDPVHMAIAISQAVYASTFKDNKSKAVILVRSDRLEEAVLANSLIHHPIDAPILYVEANHLPEPTAKEMKRLGPEGVVQDGNVQVYLVGEIGPKVEAEVKKLGFTTRRFQADSIFALSRKLDQYSAVMHANHIDDLIIAQIDHEEYYISALSWLAHMNASLLFVQGNEIPKETRQALAERPQDAFIYLMGPPDVISEEVAQKLIPYGHVQRIPGNDPFQVAVAFAGYKDIGPNFGWWVRKSSRAFGWGIAEPGHNFIFGNAQDSLSLIPASILSHRGKHGPMLLVKENQLPEPVKKYLQTVQPTYVGAQEQVFNHGWIIGNETKVSDRVWKEINQLLRVKRGGDAR